MVRVVCDFPGNTLMMVQVFFCSDCIFWCGRCSEPSLRGKKSLNLLASSNACDKFSKRNGC